MPKKSEPNIQNVPIRTETAAKIRELFVADRNYVYLPVDYSALEERVFSSFMEIMNGPKKGTDGE